MMNVSPITLFLFKRTSSFGYILDRMYKMFQDKQDILCILKKILLILSNPLVKISREKTSHVPGNLFCSNRTSTIQQLFIRIVERFRNLPARVFPFVDQLFKHARVRMLGNKALAQQFE